MAALILVDCATSGSKMYLALQRSDSPHVSNTEVGSMPAVHGSFQGTQQSGARNGLIGDFRARLQRALAHLAPGVAVQAVVIGLTTWWRKLSFDERAGVYEGVLRHLRDAAEEVAGAPCRFEPLTETFEATLEREAVVYAARQNLGYSDVDLVLSGGNSSVNFLPSSAYQTSAQSVPLCIIKGQEEVRDRGLEVWRSECSVQVDRTAGLFCKEMICLSPPPTRLTLVAIGSHYWGGRAAGLAAGSQEHSLEHVLAQLRARLEATKDAPEASQLREAANLVRLVCCLERVFPSCLRGAVRVVFARDWVVNGEPFRATWTSGYFIRHGAPGRACELQPKAVPWMEPPDPGWLDLSYGSSTDFKHVLCFDDSEDLEMHEVPYARRLELLDVVSVQPFGSTGPNRNSTGTGLLWSQVALSPHLVGPTEDGHHAGVQLSLPSADAFSRFVVVSLVGCRPGGGSAPSYPRPAVGFNRRAKDIFPVVDIGIIFDAKMHTVQLQRGTVQQRRKILGSRDVPWDATASARYHIWLESQGGRTWLRFARNQLRPTALVEGKVQAWSFEIDASTLALPAAVHVWVGLVKPFQSRLGLSNRTRASTRSALTTQPADPSSDAAWTRVCLSPLERVPGGWRWAKGSFCSSMARASLRARICAHAVLPTWVGRSFTRHHAGEDGIRRLAVWPPPGCPNATADALSWPSLVATAGEFDVWVFGAGGEGAYHCTFEDAEVWSVAILGVQRMEPQARKDTNKIVLRILVGCAQGRCMLHEQTVVIDDPSSSSGCVLRERTMAVDEHTSGARAWGARGVGGHTAAVTAIMMDHRRGLVYTVSYDKTAIQWDASGALLSQARGFHKDKIINCALSAGGCWLATAGFDHVALFSADGERGLTCVALVDHDWDNWDMDRRWFATAFLPPSLVSEPESTSQLPSAMLTGDMLGNMWLVSLLSRDGTRRSSDGMLQFVSAVTEGINLEPHRDCVRQLCWVEADVLVGLACSAGSSGPERGCRGWGRFRRRHLLHDANTKGGSGRVCRRSSCSVAPGEALSTPLLCSTSSDRTIHLYDSKDLFEAYETLLQWHREPQARRTRGHHLRPSHGCLTRPLDEQSNCVAFAIEMNFHQTSVRAAGVDAFGRLYTGSRRLAKWEGLPSYNWGDRVLVPTLCVREAYFLEVAIYFANVGGFALQMLYFSSNHGVFEKDKSARGTILPIALLTSASVFESFHLVPRTGWPFWRTVMALAMTLTVFFCPSLLRSYYDAQTQYELDEHNHTNRRRQFRRALRCYILCWVFFGLAVIPTFKEMALLLNCPRDEHGTRRMSTHRETECFRGTHLAMTILGLACASLYLACILLFEIVNFDLSALLETKLGNQAAFPPVERFGEGAASWASRKHITLGRFFYVMFRHLLPDLRLQPPQQSVGIFTQSAWADNSLQVRFLSKVAMSGLHKLDAEWVTGQMAIVACISLANFLVNLVYPPLLDPRLKRLTLVVQASIAAGSALALSALLTPPSRTSAVLHAVAYSLVVVLPLCAWLSASALRRTCSSCACGGKGRRASGKLQASGASRLVVAEQRQPSRSAWGDDGRRVSSSSSGDSAALQPEAAACTPRSAAVAQPSAESPPGEALPLVITPSTLHSPLPVSREAELGARGAAAGGS